MSESDIQVILYRLDELDKKVDEVRAEQKAVTSRGVCPNPGSCIVLQRDVENMQTSMPTLEQRLRALESLRDEARGVGVAARALWAFIGAGGLGVIYTVAHFLSQHVAK